MIKGSEVRKADHQIERLLIDRWSPRAMSGEEISQEELMRLDALRDAGTLRSGQDCNTKRNATRIVACMS